MEIFSIISPQWCALIAIVLYMFYKWATSTYNFFEDKGVVFEKPIPLFGNWGKLLFGKQSLHDMVHNLYKKYSDKSFFGVYELRTPLLFVRDRELIRQITVKDFDHFQDHRVILSEDIEPLFGRSLVSLTGERWREMRSTLSPAFTGSKMRLIFQFVSECGKDTIENLLFEADKSDKFVPDMKDLFTRFTNDVIASSAFGIEINSWKDKENEFFVMGKKSTQFNLRAALKFFTLINFPKLCSFFKMTLFTNEQSSFYRRLVHDSIRYRERENIIRPDMINLLMLARKGALSAEDQVEMNKENVEKHESFATVNESMLDSKQSKSKWEDDDLTAQCMLFFIAGFETSSTLMCFTAHELTENYDVQQKLIDEIDQIQSELNGKPLTYDILQKMKYMDMVISESLRKWPPSVATDRICVKPFILKDERGGSVLINKNDNIWIPIYGIHHDPKYFENPDKFDPERFSDENKHKIQTFTYLPFGAGPRNCIGSRFALMECKAILFYLLTSFTFEISEKTQIPLKLAKAGFSVKAEKGFFIHLKPRNRQ